MAFSRWLAGPLIAVATAGGTVALAGVVMPRGPRPPVQKPMGKLRINTDPTGASLTVDGKHYPRFTPTTIEGEIGATLKLGFELEGYQKKEADVYVAEGEHPFSVRLDRLEPVAAPAPPPEPEATPEPAAQKHHHHAAVAPKAPVGKGKVSIFVRPWAIVFVDKVRLRQTPVQNYELAAGKHVIELVNEGKERREKIEIDLAPDEEQEIKRDWDK
jgi:hypothetical protein